MLLFVEVYTQKVFMLLLLIQEVASATFFICGKSYYLLSGIATLLASG
jgi:hypothetical protein